jgi:hypothetical protein
MLVSSVMVLVCVFMYLCVCLRSRQCRLSLYRLLPLTVSV